MVETRRKRAALVARAEPVGAELAGARQRGLRDATPALAPLRGAGSDLAEMLDRASKKKRAGLLASDLGQMLSAAWHVLEHDSAPSRAEADSDGTLTAPASPASVRSAARAPGIPPVMQRPWAARRSAGARA